MSKCTGASQLWCQQLQAAERIPADYCQFVSQMRRRFVNPDQNHLELATVQSIQYLRNPSDYISTFCIILSKCLARSLDDNILSFMQKNTGNITRELWSSKSNFESFENLFAALTGTETFQVLTQPAATRVSRQREIDVCQHCKKHGHRKDCCWILHGKPKEKSRSMQSQELDSQFETIEFAKYSTQPTVEASSFMSKNVEQIISFIVESGCSDHMIPDKGLFSRSSKKQKKNTNSKRRIYNFIRSRYYDWKGKREKRLLKTTWSDSSS
jgi:tRNA U38,U39,U40 pseudouridine synthase TruA